MEVTLLDHMGSDLSVVNAARVSFSKESEWQIRDCPTFATIEEVLSEKDAKLIRYLAKHNHWTPFGHCFASFRIKAPIFVARQLGKHQVGLVWNEVSRRYVDDEPEFYTPETWRKRADNVKQGSSDEASTWDGFGFDWKDDEISIQEYYKTALSIYESMIHTYDVCPEQARMVLPQSMMTEWVWSGSLAAFARVCKLRLDPHTQKETRLVAEQIDAAMGSLFPVSWKALNEATD
jgi:thymidylate synthase (FAD)